MPAIFNHKTVLQVTQITINTTYRSKKIFLSVNIHVTIIFSFRLFNCLCKFAP